MTSLSRITIIVRVICYFLAAVLLYSAGTKFIDLETFKISLYISEYVNNKYVSYLYITVPTVELLLALFLIFYHKRRREVLFSAFTLFIIFTLYYALSKKEGGNQCACGGFLNELSFSQHLTFNIMLIGLSLVGLVLHDKIKLNENR
jgi:Methylamine utilisation protein MauE